MKKMNLKTIDYSDWIREILEEEPLLLERIKISTQLTSKEEAQKALTEVVKFLALIVFTKTKLTPSVIVDDAWHEFILFTRLYHRFCEQKFGRYIHHQPGGEEKENHKRFYKTLQLYILSIGEPPKQFWGTIAEQLHQNADCGNCLAD